MGELVAMHYPAALFANLADHTYVKCGTGGKAWGCWGDSVGGAELGHATGSTVRADAIAEPNERAGVTCYLVNGVCHQAANRILLPAGLTVSGARGYDVSEALFGTYGRPRGVLGFCQAPFDQHAGVTGDLPACAATAAVIAVASRGRRRIRRARRPATRPSARQRAYLAKVRAAYRQASPVFATAAVTPGTAPAAAVEREIERFHVELFRLKVAYQLPALSRRTASRLDEIRRSTERSRLKLDEWLLHREMSAAEFAAAVDADTVRFQHEVAGALKAPQYRKLLGLAPGTAVLLADPRIVPTALAHLGRS